MTNLRNGPHHHDDTMRHLSLICLAQALMVWSGAWTHRPRHFSMTWTPCTPHHRYPLQSPACSTSTAARSCRAFCLSCTPGLIACRLCSSQRLLQGPQILRVARHPTMQHCLLTSVDRMSLVSPSVIRGSQPLSWVLPVAGVCSHRHMSRATSFARNRALLCLAGTL